MVDAPYIETFIIKICISKNQRI